MKAIVEIEAISQKKYSDGKIRTYFLGNGNWYHITPKCVEELGEGAAIEKGQPWLVDWFDTKSDGTTFHNVQHMKLAYDLPDKDKVMFMLEQLCRQQGQIIAMLQNQGTVRKAYVQKQSSGEESVQATPLVTHEMPKKEMPRQEMPKQEMPEQNAQPAVKPNTYKRNDDWPF